jgi:hypothetical protein
VAESLPGEVNFSNDMNQAVSMLLNALLDPVKYEARFKYKGSRISPPLLSGTPCNGMELFSHFHSLSVEREEKSYQDLKMDEIVFYFVVQKKSNSRYFL